MRQLSDQHDIYSKHSWESLPLATVIVIYSPFTAVDRVQVTLQASGVQPVPFFLTFTKNRHMARLSIPLTKLLLRTTGHESREPMNTPVITLTNSLILRV